MKLYSKTILAHRIEIKKALVLKLILEGASKPLEFYEGNICSKFANMLGFKDRVYPYYYYF